MLNSAELKVTNDGINEFQQFKSLDSNIWSLNIIKMTSNFETMANLQALKENNEQFQIGMQLPLIRIGEGGPIQTQDQRIGNKIGEQPRVESIRSLEKIKGVRNSDDQIEQIQRKRWTEDEEQVLLNLHNKLGNKWTIIANYFSGKDHNCIKNHFYAQLRKSMRRINHFIKVYFGQQFKPMNMNLVSKTITMLSEKGEKLYFFQGVEANYQNKVEEFKQIMFKIAKKEQSENLSSLQVEQLQKFLMEINEAISEIKKIHLNKKKKSKVSKTPQSSSPLSISVGDAAVVKVQEQAPKFTSFPTCDELPNPQLDSSGGYNSFIFVYCNQMQPCLPVFNLDCKNNSSFIPRLADPALVFYYGSLFGNS